MKCKIVKLNEIIDDAKCLYNNNLQATPYQNIEFMLNVGISTSEKMIFLKRSYKELNIAVYDDELIMILPLVYKITNLGIFVHLRGEFVGAGHLGALYSQKSNERHLESALLRVKDFFNSKYKAKKIFIKFKRIREDLKFNSLLRNIVNCSVLEITEQKCLFIPIDGTRDDWYKSLGKSARQNLRTSYNRIRKDNISIHTKTYINKEVPCTVYSQITKLYTKRILEKSGQKFILNNPVCNYFLFRLKKKNKFNKTLSSDLNTFTQVLYLNNEVAAFCQGYISNDNRIIIPHLSYNSKYCKFSPGAVMIDLCIKYITENRSDKFYINKLDLSCGDEKYKYFNGGIEYLNFHYLFCLNEVN